MSKSLVKNIQNSLEELENQGLFKGEHVLLTPQDAEVRTDRGKVINLCANNYLGLANRPELVQAAKEGLDAYGYGAASVRFICGTQTVHKALEKSLSTYLGFEDTILFSSCFDANGGVFEALLDAEDVVISDQLNHASIIDGVRLCKAARMRYANNDMAELEACLQKSQDKRNRLIVTDGVFSMDGVIADLDSICTLAEKYDALVMVDDSHAVGVLGELGRGTHEYKDVMGRVDILTGTLGKALGGASGGYVCAAASVVSWLRQKARPYLFSNTLAPSISAASIRAIEMAQQGKELRRQLEDNARFFRQGLTSAGFSLVGEDHPIIPVIIGDASLAKNFSSRLMDMGIYAVAFSYPVVPKGKARIRTQMSASLTRSQLERTLDAFISVGRELGLINTKKL